MGVYGCMYVGGVWRLECRMRFKAILRLSAGLLICLCVLDRLKSKKWLKSTENKRWGSGVELRRGFESNDRNRI